MRKSFFLVSLCMLVLAGCSEGAHDRLLRFFFDVPEESGYYQPVVTARNP